MPKVVCLQVRKMNSEQCIDLQYSTAAATPTAESDVLVDERAASAGAAEGIEMAGGDGSACSLSAALPSTAGRQRRWVVRQDDRMAILRVLPVQALGRVLAPDRDRASRTSESGCGHGRILAHRGSGSRCRRPEWPAPASTGGIPDAQANRTAWTPARRRDHATTERASSVDRPQHLHGVWPASCQGRGDRTSACCYRSGDPGVHLLRFRALVGSAPVRSGGTEPLVRLPDAKLEAGSRC